MVSTCESILLAEHGKMRLSSGNRAGRLSPDVVKQNGSSVEAREPFLRIPPFPGARIGRFATVASSAASCEDVVADIKRHRVGGTFWGAQPQLPAEYVLVTSAAAVGAAVNIAAGRPVVFWERAPDHGYPASIQLVCGVCDPWHMLSNAAALVTQHRDELALIADLLNVDCYDLDRETGEVRPVDVGASEALARELSGIAFENPFTGAPMDAVETVRLCGFWRRLIDSNRDIAGGLGFAFWKRDHIAPLLWGGSAPIRFMRSAEGLRSDAPVAVWRTRISPGIADELERAGIPLIEVEDGFLRSRGLGADCIPPLSITVDRLGTYFDPSRPSELECLLETGEFDADLLRRARDLRGQIVEAGIGKYAQGQTILERPAGERRHILVPGQVEDDRAVQSGGCGLTSNLELLKRARRQAPDAYILYKPHPDVLAGHRRGQISRRSCLEYADQIVGEVSISSLIGMVDEVHVNTSLTGFEALLRGKSVTTHGAPFYAGWGLTRDLGPVPLRRTRRRHVDELVAAALLLYPRYLDPGTGLPCPAEVIVSRLCSGVEHDRPLIVSMRRLQGRFMRHLRSLSQ